MIGTIKRLLVDEDGTAIVEYALTSAIMTGVMLAAVNVITAALTGTVNDLSTALNANEVAGY